MHTTEVLAVPRIERRPLFASIILDALRGMEKGSLRLTLPDGEVLTFGDARAIGPANIRVLDNAFFQKCLLYGDVGFGESYVAGDWETDDITRVINWFLLNIEHAPLVSGSARKAFALNLLRAANRVGHLLRPNSRTGSRKNIARHYDLSNEFFQLVLDPGMTYSSGYFRLPGLSLEEAQQEKYDRLCRQLRLKPTDRLLEIGTGWGGFALHAAKRYGCRVTTITVSREQHAFAIERIRREGLEELIEVRLQDYRDVTGEFDKIASIEMLEAVGERYFEAYFARCNQLLARDGILAVQVITSPDSRYEAMRRSVDWIQKHIFPGSLLPSVGRINRAVNRTSELFLHDVNDLGIHYVRTLRMWRENFHRNLDAIRLLGFDEQFVRKWNYYLSYCEAAFTSRNISVVQMVYALPNNRQLNEELSTELS
jgi:cyclopropane-fatty-acyl-phospholipid synthase